VNKVLNLSVIIITKNEEKDIRACLESVKDLSNDIVIVDSGSTDKTLDICRSYTQKIFHNEFKGYSQQKQAALEHAERAWVLNIDADERVSDALKDEIRALLGNNSYSQNGFLIPFRNYFLGGRLRFGSVRSEKHIRLFKRDQAQYGLDNVHEGIVVKPPVSELKNPIDHYSYQTIEEYLKKCNWYTSLSAEEKYAQGIRFRFYHHLRLPYEFFVRYFLKLGFLDGKRGLLFAFLSAYYVWMKYVKILDVEQKKE